MQTLGLVNSGDLGDAGDAAEVEQPNHKIDHIP